MGLLLKQIFALVKLLNSETGTNQIASGFAAGFVLGMTPFFSLQSILIFMCLFIFRIQIGAAFLSAFFFSFVAFLLDPVFDAVGMAVLNADSLQGLFTAMYNAPLIPFTRFNNTVVMGSGLVSLLLSPLVFIIGRKLIHKYRVTVLAKFQETKLWKAVKATSFYKWYYSYENIYG